MSSFSFGRSPKTSLERNHHMYTHRRSIFPRPLIFIAFGFLLASMFGTVGAAAGTLLVLPLLLLKMMFVFFMFSFVFRFAGARGPWGWTRHRGRPHNPRPAAPRKPTEAEKDWEQAVKSAREEIDKLFPDRQD